MGIASTAHLTTLNNITTLKTTIYQMKKTIFIGLLFTMFLQACTEKTIVQESAPVQLPLYTLQNTETNTTNTYPASIQGAVDIEIRPQVGGILENIAVDEGAYVTKGQLLFKINDLPFKEQLNNALAAVNAAKAALINTQIEIDRLTPLVENKVVSEYQLKTAQAAHKVALSNVEQAQAIVENAKINLSYTRILAPVTGYIGRLPKRQGSLLTPNDVEALTTLSNIEKVYVYFSLGEMDFINFKNQYAGDQVEDILKGLPPVKLELADKSIYEENGKIDVVDGKFDKNTGSILLRATFPNPKRNLRSGNTGKIQLDIAHNNALLIPQASTIEIQDKVFVFYVDSSNKVVKKPIDIIGQTTNQYLIGNSLKVGDRIVLKGFEKLQDGMQVLPETNTVANVPSTSK